MTKERWEVKCVHFANKTMQNELGEKDWQPFAVENGHIFYRKIIRFNPKEEQQVNA